MDSNIAQFFIGLVAGFFALTVGLPIFFAFARVFGLYTIVRERECQVFMLFGKVVGIIDEPGLHFPLARLGPRALIVRLLGSVRKVDMRLDQEYLRSQPVNSEEGAPMGIGIWYEMFVSDPVSFLYKNADPRGSLSANVSNAAVRCLSNMPLERMLTSRHEMSLSVRQDVSPKSQDWGYRLGSVYVRKVHFRDAGMIRQIEEKVVNRLRQVTSAIKQDGANQVSIITSTADRQAAIEFARAAAMRPKIVGDALRDLSTDVVIAKAMFEVLEAQSIIDGHADLILVPPRSEYMTQLMAAVDLTTQARGAPPPLPSS